MDRLKRCVSQSFINTDSVSASFEPFKQDEALKNYKDKIQSSIIIKAKDRATNMHTSTTIAGDLNEWFYRNINIGFYTQFNTSYYTQLKSYVGPKTSCVQHVQQGLFAPYTALTNCGKNKSNSQGKLQPYYCWFRKSITQDA